MENRLIQRTIDNLSPGDHLCCFYETDEEHRALLAPFMVMGLELNEKVFYIVDARTAETVLGYLRDEGLDVEPYLESGQLSILTVEDAYMRTGTFDPDGMIELLKSETDQAIGEGYSALRVTGEMSWALKGLPGSERLIEYESKLNEFFPGSRSLAMCQYDLRLFGPEILLGVLVTHPIIVVGTEVYDNFYYVPTPEFFGDNLPASILENWLGSLEDRHRAEKTLRESEELYRELVEASPEAIVVVDFEGNILAQSKNAKEITGYDEGDLSGTSVFALIPESYQDLLTSNLETLRETGRLAGGELGTTRKDGTEVLVEVNASTIKDEDGNPSAIVAVVKDITERKRAEKALRDSEERYRTLVENLQEGIWKLDKDGFTTFVNRRMAEMLGYAEGEMLGKHLFEFMDEEAGKAAERNLDRRRQGIAEQHDFVFTRKDGTRIVTTLETSPLYDAEGGYAGALAGVMDVTARKAAEEALKEEQAFTETVINSLKDVFYVLSIKDNGLLVRWNKAFNEETGYSDEELARMTVFDFFDAEGQETQQRFFEELMKTGSAMIEVDAIMKDGRRVPYQFRSTLVRDEKGDPLYVTGVGRDITERKAAEEALRRTSDYLESLIGYANAPIIVWDGEIKIKRFNHAFERLTGYAADEVIDRELPILFPVETREESMGKIERTSGGEYWESVEIPILRKDGNTRIALWNSASIFDRDGKTLIATIAQGQDITERKEAEEALRAANAELDGFAHTVSHDLKGPLTSILFASGTLQEMLNAPPTDENVAERREMGDIIARNVGRSSDIIDDLLALAEAGQVPEHIEDIDVKAIVDRVLEERAPDIETKRIEIKVDVDLGSLRANRTHVYQVFTNLLGNAIKHNDSATPVIEVKYLGDNGKGARRYLVRDNGSGIAPDDLENIFIPFFKGKTGETGIGLSTVEKIVKLYGGSISAYNDNGACFEFSMKDFD